MYLKEYKNNYLHIRFGSDDDDGVDYWFFLPEHLYEEFIASENKQQFFLTRIDGLYEYLKREPK